MKSFLDYLMINEANASTNEIGAVSDLIVGYLNKRGSSYNEYGRITIEKDGKTLIQNLYIDEQNDNAIGINFKDDGGFFGISVWETVTGFGKEETSPDKEITFEADGYDSFVAILPELRKTLIDIDGEIVGVPASTNDVEELTQKETKPESRIEVSVGRSQKEKDPDIKEAKSKLNQVKYADTKTSYRKLENYTKAFANGKIQSLLVTGNSGSGKIYVVEEVLDGLASTEWRKLKGCRDVKTLYMYLFNNYDKLIVLEDCDSILEDKDSINVLKDCMDTGDYKIIGLTTDNSINTEGLTHDEILNVLSKDGVDKTPSEFEFKGQIIFISDMTVDEIKTKVPVIVNRCELINVSTYENGIQERIESVLPSIKYHKARTLNGKIYESTNEKDKREVFEYLSKPLSEVKLNENDKILSIGTLIRACKLKATCPNNWKDMLI